MAIGTPVYLGAQSSASAASTVDIETLAAVPAGALIIVCVIAKSQTNYGGWSVSGGGLTWQEDGRWEQTFSSKQQIEFFSAPAPSGLASATDISVVNDGSDTNWGEMAFAIYCEGLDTGASRFDGSATLASGHGTDGGTSVWSINEDYTTTNADDLLVIPVMSDGNGAVGDIDFNSPIATMGAEHYNAANTWSGAIGYRILASAGNYLPAGTFSPSPAFGFLTTAGAYKAGEPAEPEPEPSYQQPKMMAPGLRGPGADRRSWGVF